MTLRDDDRGQVAILLVGFAALLLAIAAFVVDAGLAFTERLRLTNVADGAARAGAAAIVAAERATTEIRVDTAQAEIRVRRYLEQVDCGCDVVLLHATPEAVTLRIRREQKTFLMGVLGISSIEIGATATAKPVIAPSPSG